MESVGCGDLPRRLNRAELSRSKFDHETKNAPDTMSEALESDLQNVKGSLPRKLKGMH